MNKLCYVMLALTAISMVGCKSENSEKKQSDKTVKVKVMAVAQSSDGVSRNFSGTVEESSGSILSFSSVGTIKSLNVKVGDKVSAGQLIATLDATAMQSSYTAAKSTLLQAEDAYKRMKELYDKGSLPEIKFVEIQSKLEQAKSMEEIARKSLSDCRLYAPFSGVISEKSAEIGQNMMPGLPVVKLVSVNTLNVKIAVPEGEIANVAIGQKATITIAALNNRTLMGVVSEKGIVANTLSRSYDVKIRVSDTDKQLMPGMVANVVMSGISKSNDSRHIIPAHIVQLDEDNSTFVWIKIGDKATKRNIVCGEYCVDGVEVVSGLNAGDEIIIEGQQKVCEDTKVSI